MNKSAIVAVLYLLAVPAKLPAADGMRAGLWEVTSAMDMPGMPFKIPPTTITHCFTSEEVMDQKNVINKDKECTVTDFRSTGNRVSWQMKCTGRSAGTYSGESRFTADSYTSDMKMQADEAGGMPMSIKVTGKRLGVCP